MVESPKIAVSNSVYSLSARHSQMKNIQYLESYQEVLVLDDVHLFIVQHQGYNANIAHHTFGCLG